MNIELLNVRIFITKNEVTVMPSETIKQAGYPTTAAMQR